MKPEGYDDGSSIAAYRDGINGKEKEAEDNNHYARIQDCSPRGPRRRQSRVRSFAACTASRRREAP
jgi:hypothetical protein